MIIYKITNVLNRKIYIGQTTRTLNARKAQHLKDAKEKKKNFRLYRAFNKYGSDNFLWEVIDTTDDVSKLDSLERSYIKLYKSNIPAFGYNATEGGTGGAIYWSDVSKNKRRDQYLKSKNPFYGKKHTDESKRKMANSNPKVWLGKKRPEISAIQLLSNNIKAISVIITTPYGETVYCDGNFKKYCHERWSSFLYKCLVDILYNRATNPIKSGKYKGFSVVYNMCKL